jgi:N-acetylmuramoyl-L-alanine amidase
MLKSPKNILLVIFFNLLVLAQAQEQLILVSGDKTSYLPAYKREGQIYFSLVHFAEALSVKYTAEAKHDKVQVEFTDYSLQAKIKNPFIVLKSKQNESVKVIQLATSTYFINNILYLPLNYLLPSLRTASGWQLNLIEKNKLIVSAGKIPKVKGVDISKSRLGITGFTLDEKANGTLVRLISNIPIATYNSSFKDGLLTVVFRDVNLDESKFSNENKRGLIKDISAKNVGSDCEIKFYLREEFTTSEVLNSPQGNDILITLHNKIFTNNKEKAVKSERWSFDAVVIDAGHGGKDYGAIGVNKTREKDINLSIGLKLGKEIEKELKDVKVVYTRKDDRFIELYKRGKIANDNNGKLFISIHCNSTAKKNSDASGFEVYLLRPGKTQDAIEIAETENAVIQYEADPTRYQKLTDENFILVSMAHSSYMKYSEKFAELLHNQFSNDFSLDSRGVKQAGFYVLVGASMPSVLVESGFLSNKKDAEYLKSTKGQDEIAAAIFRAVKGYKAYYDKIMEAEL